jgi:hypothetical protein
MTASAIKPKMIPNSTHGQRRLRDLSSEDGKAAPQCRQNRPETSTALQVGQIME